MSDEPQLRHIYITKRALEDGIIRRNYAPSLMTRRGANTTYLFRGETLWPPDWHRTWEAAKKQARNMRSREIASLEKQLNRVRALKFAEPKGDA